MKKIKKILFNLLLVLLILIGLGLIFNKGIRNMLLAMQSNRYQITKVSKETIKKNNQKGVGKFDFSKVDPISFEDVMKNQWKNEKLPVIGGIAVPDIGINLPIFRGVGNAELSYGAGTMKENQVMGRANYALASHSISGVTGPPTLLFTPLERAEKGMMIYLTDKDTIYQYQIRDKKVMAPNHVEVIDDHPGVNELTLVTCADMEAVNRIIVFADYLKSFPVDKAESNIKKAFESSYNQATNF